LSQLLFLRAAIRSEVSAIKPLDAVEDVHRADALAWIDSGVALCRTAKPATPPMHLVSYFAVIDDGHILLVDHKNAQLWLPAGGHVEPDEHPRTTVARELREELGFELPHEVAEPLMITTTTTVGLTAGHTDVSLWYVVRASRAQRVVYDQHEFNGVSWFRYEDVPLSRSDPHLGRFLRKLSQQSLPP